MASLSNKIRRIAQEFGIPSDLFNALVQVESSFNPDAIGPVGEIGLTQLTAPVADKYGVSNPFDVDQNLRGGAAFLSDLKRKYGNWRDALSHYNAGFNLRAGRSYADKVLAVADTQLDIPDINNAGTDAVKAVIGKANTGNNILDRMVDTFKRAFIDPYFSVGKKVGEAVTPEADTLISIALWALAIIILVFSIIKLIGA